MGPGENPSIICTATGDEPLHIEWEAIGRPLPYTVTHHGGILQFHGITYSDAGKYVCKATNGAGTAEAVAEVLVNGWLIINFLNLQSIQFFCNYFLNNFIWMRKRAISY